MLVQIYCGDGSGAPPADEGVALDGAGPVPDGRLAPAGGDEKLRLRGGTPRVTLNSRAP
jgi:hypothetical protein